MICLGCAQMSPGPLDSEAAQLHAVGWFRDYFLAKFPTGIVISELEYMGRTTSPSSSPTPLRTFGRPVLNQILDALAHDFRRWARERDYRKCDALGIANDGLNAELLEVTTESNSASAAAQMTAKLATLRTLVNRVHRLHVDWRPTPWRPNPATQSFRPLDANPQQVRYLCYLPTARVPIPGVVLYEIHVLSRQTAAVPAPAPAPERAAERIRPVSRGLDGVEQRARQFLDQNPDIAGWIRLLAMTLAVASVIAAIVALINPIPGDEVAAFTFASALFRLATAR